VTFQGNVLRVVHFALSTCLGFFLSPHYLLAICKSNNLYVDLLKVILRHHCKLFRDSCNYPTYVLANHATCSLPSLWYSLLPLPLGTWRRGVNYVFALVFNIPCIIPRLGSLEHMCHPIGQVELSRVSNFVTATLKLLIPHHSQAQELAHCCHLVLCC